jgi:hypothetical protein
VGLLLAGRWSVAWSLIVELPALTHRQPGSRHAAPRPQGAIAVSTLILATLDTLHQHGVRVLRSDAQYAMIYGIMSIDTTEAVTVVS